MKEFLKKAWQFLWHEDSWYAWIAQILVAFIIIKFILYPAIGLVFGTQLPVVAVVSGSMEHNGDVLCAEDQGDWWNSCGQWYTNNNITQEQFQEFSFKNGFNKGDVIALKGIDTDKIEIGDVIVYQANKQYPIIHRVVDITENGFITKGDNNPEPIQQYVITNGFAYSECYQESSSNRILVPCSPNSIKVTADTPGAIQVLDETRVQPEAVIGKAYGRIPYVGYVKIWFVEILDFIGLDALATRI
jgi:signal peptidase I